MERQSISIYDNKFVELESLARYGMWLPYYRIQFGVDSRGIG